MPSHLNKTIVQDLNKALTDEWLETNGVGAGPVPPSAVPTPSTIMGY